MSSVDKTSTIALDDETNALSIYLDAMLAETERVPQGLATPTQDANEMASSTERPSDVNIEPKVDISIHTVKTSAQPSPSSIEILMFKVAGLSLAVPLLDLSGVEEWCKSEVIKVPGQPTWSLGMMTYRDKTVPIIDIAQLVIPKDHLAKLTTPTEDRIRRIVFIGDGRWGLACDSVEDVLTLTSEQIRWRMTPTNRKWLAGTIIEHMCALLNAKELSDILSSEGNRGLT